MSQAKLTVLMDEDLRRAFLLAAQERDTTASQLVRSWARSYVAANGQRSLFDDQEPPPAKAAK